MFTILIVLLVVTVAQADTGPSDMVPTLAPSPLYTPMPAPTKHNYIYMPTMIKWDSLNSTTTKISGRLIYSDETPNNGIAIRLAKIINCDFIVCYFLVTSDTSSITITDDDGLFEFTEIKPSRYVLLIKDDISWWILSSDDDGQEIWNVYNNLDIGNIIFD